jgi:short-chain fatty acids transporter
MVLHGGFSGSSLAKVAQEGHLKSLMAGQISAEKIAALPEAISYDETVFGAMNIAVALALIVILPLFMRFLGRRNKASVPELGTTTLVDDESVDKAKGADRLDWSKWFGLTIGIVILLVFFYKAWTPPRLSSLGFIDPNWINLGLLGMALLAHRSIHRFLKAVDEAIGGAAGILIQFPLYFGIMGIMKGSGLVTMMSDFFISVSNETTYPIFTFISAGIVNVFVPSEGGQWAVQGPIIVQAAGELNVSLSKSILAMAYGDQLTNMLQPFWALPLLGITGLKAKEILPYTLLLMVVGAAIFIGGLLLF